MGAVNAAGGMGVAVSTATATAAKAAFQLFTKIIAGVLASTVVIGGGVVLLTKDKDNEDYTASSPPIMESVPLVTDSTDVSVEADEDAAVGAPLEIGPGEEEDEEEPIEVESQEQQLDVATIHEYTPSG